MMAVSAETKPGTMTEGEGRSKVSPSAGVKTPDDGSKVSPEDAPIYSKRQVTELIHAAQSEWGRKSRDLETERETLTSKLTARETDLADIQADRDSLQKEIEDLTSDDPKKFDLIKKDRDLRKRETELKGQIGSLEMRESKLAEREKKVNAFETEVLIEAVAAEYEDGESARLKDVLDIMDNPTEEQIRKVAAIIWGKKADKEKPKAPKVYSGKSEGGSTGTITAAEIQKMTPKEITALKAKHGGKTLLELIAEGVIVQK